MGAASSTPPTTLTAREVRPLGRALDALVRSVRTQPQIAEAMATRAKELWSVIHDAPAMLAPGEIRIGGAVALGGGDDEVRWLMIAFMVGLRELRPRPGMSPQDLQRVAEEFAALDTDVDKIERFRDWLWSGGAQGFDVDLQTSFMEAFDNVAVDAEAVAAVAAVRAESMRSLSDDTIAIAAADLDAAATREEFNAPLSSGLSRAGDPRLAPPAELADALRAAVDDPDVWRAMEVAAIVRNPAFHEAVTPDRLGRQLLAAMHERVDLAVIEKLATLSRHGDTYARAVLAELDDADVMARVGDALLSNDAKGRRVAAAQSANLLVALPASAVRSLASRLLDLADTGGTKLATVIACARSVGLPRFAAFVPPESLTVPQARSIARVLVRAQGDPETLAAMLRKTSPDTSLALLTGLDVPYAEALRTELHKVVLSAPAETMTPFVEGMLEALGVEGARLLGEAVLAQSAEGWGLAPLRSVCAAVVAHGLGTELLVPLVRSRKVEPWARLHALRVLEDDTAALRVAVEWRAAELVDPAPVRERLREIRKHLKIE